MGIGINTAFEVGKKGLRAQLFGLNVTGNNIANVNTEGYSRRKVNLVTAQPLITTQGVFGAGTDVKGVERYRDKLVDKQVRTAYEEVGKQEVREKIRRLAPGGGYALGSSNSVAYYTPIENYIAMLQATFDYGKYPISI